MKRVVISLKKFSDDRFIRVHHEMKYPQRHPKFGKQTLPFLKNSDSTSTQRTPTLQKTFFFCLRRKLGISSSRVTVNALGLATEGVEPEVETEMEPELETEVEPEIEPQVEPEIEPEVEPEVETEMEFEVEPKIELEVEPERWKNATFYTDSVGLHVEARSVHVF